MTIVRPVPQARLVGGARFCPAKWGDQTIRVRAPGGAHLLIRRHGAPELKLWLPDRLVPAPGGRFGIYLPADTRYGDRVRAAARFHRAIGLGPALRIRPFADAHRQAAMLCIHDLTQAGASLRDIAGELLVPFPDDWRSSAERSDLRRLADTATKMIEVGYRHLLACRIS